MGNDDCGEFSPAGLLKKTADRIVSFAAGMMLHRNGSARHFVAMATPGLLKMKSYLIHPHHPTRCVPEKMFDRCSNPR